MTHKTYLLVISNLTAPTAERLDPLAHFSVLKVLEPGDSAYVFDWNMIFINSNQDVEALTERLRAGPIRDGQFFLADIGDVSRAGNMTPSFWDFLRSKDKLTSAA